MKLTIVFVLSIFFIECSCFSQNNKIDSLITETKSLKQDIPSVNLLIYLSRLLHYDDKTDTGLYYAKKAYELSEAMNYRKGVGLSLLELGKLHCQKLLEEKGIEEAKKSLKIFNEINDSNLIAKASFMIATLMSRSKLEIKTRNSHDVIKFYSSSLEIYERLNDKINIAKALTELASEYGSLNDYKSQIRLLNRALTLAVETKDYFQQAATCRELGSVYSEIGGNTHYKTIPLKDSKSVEKAIKYYEKSLRICDKVREDNESDANEISSVCLNAMAYLYADLQQNNKSLKSAMKSLFYAKKYKEKQEDIANAYGTIGDIYQYMNDYEMALKFGDSCRIIALNCGRIDFVRDLYLTRSSIYEKMGNTTEALKFYKKYIQTKDSLLEVENVKSLTALASKYQSQTKENEIEYLTKDKEVQDVKLTQQRLVLVFVSVGMLLVVVFAVFIFRSLKQNKKKNKIITEQKALVELQKFEVETQKHLVEEKHKEIIDSINYAQRIQRSLLASEELLNKNLNEYFILFMPKDVVSGDFYWASKLANGNFALVTADSTGHGVPGAIMSMLNIACLNEAVTKGITNTDELLFHTRKRIIETLKNDGSEQGGKDGMDCSLLSFDFSSKVLQISAANNPVWIVRNSSGEGTENKELIEIKPDKMPVGKHDRDQNLFAVNTHHLQKGDIIYALTDGFPDQFGGEKGKKFMSKNLKELLLANCHLPVRQQKELLQDTFKNWVDELEQVDDVTVIGIKV